LLRYDWPGNVRELANAVVLAPGPRIQLGDLPAELQGELKDLPADGTTLASVERAHILASLAANNGNRGKTAEPLGIGQATLYRKLHKYRGAD
jgi:transcriptional regulator of acetoin/glycerol metabolism